MRNLLRKYTFLCVHTRYSDALSFRFACHDSFNNANMAPFSLTLPRDFRKNENEIRVNQAIGDLDFDYIISPPTYFIVIEYYP